MTRQRLRESFMSQWLPAPDPLPPLGDDSHVWAVELDAPGYDAGLWRARLSPDEQERADKFKFARDQRRYVIAHAALRDILARYTHTGAADLQFNQGANGKPKLAAPFSACGIDFNLSHSHETALVAVNDRHEMGVDIEYVKSDFEIFAVANRFFTKREVAALRALPAALRRKAFYKCWTSKEAFLKAKGTGLSGQLDEVEIACAGENVRIQAAVANWTLAELAPRDGYEAALVTKDKPAQIFCYRWQGRW
jgi:4'-phosphopantetheinyl transferase